MKNDEVLESRGFSSLQLRPLQRWPLQRSRAHSCVEMISLARLF